MTSSICCIAKNEDHYIDEWINYHLKIGFDFIYIARNDWNYEIHQSADKVVVNDVNGPQQQMNVYNHFIDVYKNKYDWCAFIDVDEFIYIKDGRSINEFLVDYADYDGVFLNWRRMGDSGVQFDWKNYSVIDRFIHGTSTLESCGKVILHLGKCFDRAKMLNPHISNIECIDPNKKYTTRNGNIYNNLNDDEPAEIYHYRNKTFTENFIRRFNTQDAFWGQNSNSNPRLISYSKLVSEFDKMNDNNQKLEGLKTLWHKITQT